MFKTDLNNLIEQFLYSLEQILHYVSTYIANIYIVNTFIYLLLSLILICLLHLVTDKVES